MAQQKALVLPEIRGTMKVTDVPIPKPGQGEILVKVHSAGLNPIDWKIQKFGAPLVKEYPAILGQNSAGVVEEIGEGVTKFQKGDKVFHQGHWILKSGTFQQYTIAASDLVAKLPSNLSFDQAAVIPLALMAASVGFYHKDGAGLQGPWEGGEGKYKDQSILIFGGTSAVGHYAIQLAKLAGFSTIISTCSPKNAELVKSTGATHTIDRNADIPAEVGKILSEPLKLIWDTVSAADTQKQSIQILAPGGTLLLVAVPTEEVTAALGDRKAYRAFGSPYVHRELASSIYAKLTEYLESGKLKPTEIEVLPNGLAGIPDGLQRLAENKVSAAKLVARPQE
ncbi:hypothetical protein M422DRAFT_162375 [Sphaerobolus stellatus SS14]|nr:hypothetical protein M422DRAFT_162375 [Sphaerobolus stellatus SS14]